MAELYQPQTTAVVFMPDGDPCANNTPAKWGNIAANPNRLQLQTLCAALIHKFDPSVNYTPGGSANNYTGLMGAYFPLALDLQQGNTNLQPETARTYTAGGVIRSPFTSAALSRLSLSVDWYDIKITGAIEPLTGEVLYQQCLNADGKSNPTYTIDGNPLCAYINREVGDGGNRNEIAPFFNFGSIKTSGVDVQLDWASELADLPLTHALPGAINLNVVVNWLAHYDVQTTPGGAVTDYAGTVNGGGGSQFRYRTYTTLTYSEGPASLGMRWRHLPSAKDGSYALDPTTLTKGVGQHDRVRPVRPLGAEQDLRPARRHRQPVRRRAGSRGREPGQRRPRHHPAGLRRAGPALLCRHQGPLLRRGPSDYLEGRAARLAPFFLG